MSYGELRFDDGVGLFTQLNQMKPLKYNGGRAEWYLRYRVFNGLLDHVTATELYNKQC